MIYTTFSLGWPCYYRQLSIRIISLSLSLLPTLLKTNYKLLYQPLIHVNLGEPVSAEIYNSYSADSITITITVTLLIIFHHLLQSTASLGFSCKSFMSSPK